MTADEIRALTLRLVQAANSHDPVAVGGCYAPDAIVESPSLGLQRGREQIQRGIAMWNAAFPDTSMVLEELLTEQDRAAAYVTIRGTHQGEYLGLPYTGKKFEFRGVYLRRFADGVVVHERRIYDFHGLLIKLGVLKVKPAS